MKKLQQKKREKGEDNWITLMEHERDMGRLSPLLGLGSTWCKLQGPWKALFHSNHKLSEIRAIFINNKFLIIAPQLKIFIFSTFFNFLFKIFILYFIYFFVSIFLFMLISLFVYLLSAFYIHLVCISLFVYFISFFILF